MRIHSAARHIPFSHRPGIFCPLPETHLSIQLFPARLSFFQAGVLLFSLDLKIQGPMLDFTVQLDLEQMQIKVFGHTQKGYLRYVLKREKETVFLKVEKLPGKQLTCHYENQIWQLTSGQKLPLSCILPQAHGSAAVERLSLGIHKKQEWERVISRRDLKEIFPIWMRLGQCTPSISPAMKTEGTLRLLEKCHSLVQEGEKQQIKAAFETLFLAGFEGILTPHLFDRNHQGILYEEGIENSTAILLLTQGAALIRSLFLQEERGILVLLPCAFSDFHAGRCVNMHTSEGEHLDFEWTKKEMRRVVFYPLQEKKAHFKFSKEFKRCRTRSSLKEKGHIHVLNEGLLSVQVAKERPLLIDSFQK